MFIADLHMDREVPDNDLEAAVAIALDSEPADVQVRPQGEVDDRDIPITVQTEYDGGDFPYLLRLSTIAGPPADLLGVVRVLAKELDAGLITDAIGVNPAFDDDWLLVAPSGATAVVSADLDVLDSDDPAIVLVPESRAIYESLVHRPLAATR